MYKSMQQVETLLYTLLRREKNIILMVAEALERVRYRQLFRAQ